MIANDDVSKQVFADIKNSMAISFDYETKIREFQDLKNNEEKLRALLVAKYFNISIGDEFEILGKFYRIKSIDIEIDPFENLGTVIQLYAQCWSLKKDGSVDDRIKPEYNNKRVAFLSLPKDDA
jgi:hypothetical protein